MTVPMPDTTPDKLLYTPLEAARALGISRSTLYVLLAGGDIASVRIGASRRIPAGALTAFINGLGYEPSSQESAQRELRDQARRSVHFDRP